jgi:hypothetical protein
MFSKCSMRDGGKWTKWGRGEGHSLSFGNVLVGQISRRSDYGWRAIIGAMHERDFSDKQSAMAYVEADLRRKMHDVLIDWHKFCAARGLP